MGSGLCMSIALLWNGLPVYMIQFHGWDCLFDNISQMCLWILSGTCMFVVYYTSGTLVK